MADLLALLQPRVSDRESLQEFIEALEDLAPGIERDVAALRKSPADRALIASLFRALHTIKGDAALCKVDVGVMICHPIESLLSRCRDGEVAFSELLAELVLLALDRLELTVEALATGRTVAQLKLPELVGGMEGMATAPAAEIAALAIRAIEAVTGFKPVQAGSDTLMARGALTNTPADRSADLQFFRSLALQFELRSPTFQGRTDRILRLAQDTNAIAGTPVDANQLEAAVYLHDVGMMFAPESVWLKVGKLSDVDKRQLHEHPGLAAGLLERMPGWAAAAKMVAQHHEMPDGGGYPAGLKGESICPGAKILAIVVAFEAVMQKHSHRGQTRSLVRAIAEINACDKQFASEWIGQFNAVIRKMVEH
ncbi:MAG: HD domain-containing phosphohydrolase [Rhodocyclaceae bacterium]|nr:HD domain-containing phosphohydrolase [Rhodocyclaceae bacterium]